MVDLSITTLATMSTTTTSLTRARITYGIPLPQLDARLWTLVLSSLLLIVLHMGLATGTPGRAPDAFRCAPTVVAIFPRAAEYLKHLES